MPDTVAKLDIMFSLFLIAPFEVDAIPSLECKLYENRYH